MRWRLIAWSAEEIQKMLTQKWLEQKLTLIMQSKCPVWRIKKSGFVKEQEAKGSLSNLGIQTLLSKIPLLNVLF